MPGDPHTVRAIGRIVHIPVGCASENALRYSSYDPRAISSHGRIGRIIRSVGAEDDFGLWEREMEAAPVQSGAGPKALVLVAGLTAAGCIALITLGQVPLGAAGLILSSLILLLWRAGL